MATAVYNPMGVRNMRVAGVFTPVRVANPSARRGLAWMGTPEILVMRTIDNTRLVRVTDPVRAQEMRQFSIAVASLFVIVMLYAWQHYRAIEFGYRNEALKMQRATLLEANREYQLTEASLRAPGRIDVLARRMGLVTPQAGQLQRLDAQSPEPQTPVLASAQSLATVTPVQ